MRRAGPPRGRSSRPNVLSLGSLVLGVGLICWALLSIGVQYVRSEGSAAPKPRPSVVDTAPPEPVPIPEPPLYPVRPVEGDSIGTLSAPALNQTWPIIEGTRTEDLKRGVGHFTQSLLPGEKDNCVLSGHRDTVFAGLGTLKVGDQLVVQTSAGTFTYVISGIRIVPKDDRTVIVPTDHAVLTVSTCYPFHYVGSAPDRYILTADIVVSGDEGGERKPGI